MSSANPVSPKVTASALGTAATGAALTIVVAALSAVTPELFDFLGAWGPVAFAGVSALGGYLAGYLTKDPLRNV